MEYVHKLDLKIDYADTDMMGVVYHANYLKFFERGRTALIEDIGYSYVAMEEAGFFAPVYDVKATYKKPLRYGDKAYVKTWIDLNDGIKTVYGYRIENEQGDLCVEGSTTHIIVSKDNFRPKSFKKTFPEWFQKYEELKKK